MSGSAMSHRVIRLLATRRRRISAYSRSGSEPSVAVRPAEAEERNGRSVSMRPQGGRGGLGGDYSDAGLARLMLVVVTWSEWEPKDDQESYQKLIRMFFGDSSTGSRTSGVAYMHECKKDDLLSDGEDGWDSPENDLGVVQPAEEGVPYELPPPRYACGKPHQWSSGTTAIEHVEELDWSGGLFRTRLLMDADRYREALKCGGDSDYWVLVDMRFQRVPKGSLLWHTSFAFWSDPPWSTHHCPAEANKLGRQKLKSRKSYKLDTEKLLKEWCEYSVPALQKLVDPKVRKTIRVSDRSYMPPTFLVAVPKRRSGALAAIGDLTGHDDRLHIPPGVSNEVLRTENYESLPQALLKGKVHAFRRFFPDGTVDEPRYLLVPDRRVSIRSSGGVSRWLLAQEEAAASGVRILTDLEAFTASELGGIDSRTQIRKNHLRIYQGVAEQAGTLWDALARLLPDATKALFLPGASKRSLDTVHRSIEMIHQTLLQGVADLDQLARNINDARSHIESTADEVADRFDRQLDHPRSGDTGPMLRDSLRGGPLDRLRRLAKEASSDADRVAESYRMLLETIGMAFDERRVREGDRLQRASVWLAVAFGVLGLSGVAQATLPLPTLSGGDHRIFLVRWVLWLITAGVILAMLVILLSPQLRVQVASRAFEKKYMVVRDFLAAVSTDHLDGIRRKQGVSSAIRRPDYEPPWQELDESLCKKFIEAWTTASMKHANTDVDAYYATGLRSRVEEWTLQTLMLTERPRDFSRYALPCLTGLYRVCTAKALKDWRDAEEMANADSAIGSAELREVYLEDRCKWLVENEPDHIDEKPEIVYKWLQHYAQWLGNRVDEMPQPIQD